jgi:hypothetical protein
MAKFVDKSMLTTAQHEMAMADMATIEFWRGNPAIAARDLLGIQLFDFQSLILTRTWVAKDAVWTITRNGGKTVLASIYIMLVQLLYPEQEVWIISKTGKQAKKLFNYIERLAMNSISDFGDLPDIYYQEMKRPYDGNHGFGHDAGGFKATLLNESYVQTLNGNPDNNRGGRGNLLVFDESGFMAEESIAAIEPFTTTNSQTKTSIKEDFDDRCSPTARPNQRLYISSASDKTTYFYKKYKDTALRMIGGDPQYYVADLTVDIPLNPTINTKKKPPLLDISVVNTMMATNPAKAMREFYNQFDEDGGDSQIIKSFTVERNSTFQLPILSPEVGKKYALLYDPASRADNSVVLIGEVAYDDIRGYYGRVVNMVKFKDLKEKGNIQMMYPDQVKAVRSLMVRYNGTGAEYENIHKVAIDAGAGGGGILYSHMFMLDFKDEQTGAPHRGIMDKVYYENQIRDFPNAYPIMRLVEPINMRTTMISRLIDLMDLGLIEFPFEYDNSGHIDMEDENGELFRKKLSRDQELALMNIDICKEEAKMIHEYKRDNGKPNYQLRTDMRNKMHDDRFYTLAMFANEIYELREKDTLTRGKKKKTQDKTILGLFSKR